MSRLYVGCRVRLVRPVSLQNYGLTGRLLAVVEPFMVINGIANCWCDFDGIGRRPSHTDELEPIQDPGHQACDADFKRRLDRLLERQGVAA